MTIEYKHIYQNSYIVSAIVLVILLAIFYLFEIGSKTTITEDGQLKVRFNWQLPVAITLIFWVMWNYVIFPPIKPTKTPTRVRSVTEPYIEPSPIINNIKSGGLHDQQIDKNIWY